MNTKRCSAGSNCLHPDGPELPASLEYFADAGGGKLASRCRACKRQKAREAYQRKRDGESNLKPGRPRKKEVSRRQPSPDAQRAAIREQIRPYAAPVYGAPIPATFRFAVIDSVCGEVILLEATVINRSRFATLRSGRPNPNTIRFLRAQGYHIATRKGGTPVPLLEEVE